MHQCTKLFYLGMTLYTCFVRSFCPSSGVQDCTYSNRHLSNRYCLLAGRQQYLFDKCLLLYVQSWTPYDGRKDRPKHAVSFQNKIIWYFGASSWFYYRNPYVCHFNTTRIVLYVENMSCHRQHLSCSENNCLTLPALQSLITIIIKSEHETFSRACLYLNIWSSQGIAQVY